MERLDLAIIGAGPAGAACAINAAIRRLNFVLFGDADASAKLKSAETVRNYPGFPALSGAELSERYAAHLREMNVAIERKMIDHIYPMDDYYALTAGEDMWEARAIVLATGVSFDKPLPGEEALIGRGVSYCATCDGVLYKGKRVMVLAYEKSAEAEAEYLAGLAGEVTYIPFYKEIARFPEANIHVETHKVRAVSARTGAIEVTADDQALTADGVFILRSAIQPGVLVPGLNTDGGHAVVARNMATNLPGCFAAGDITGRPYQVAKAIGEGAVAGLSAAEYVAAQKKTEGEKLGS